MLNSCKENFLYILYSPKIDLSHCEISWVHKHYNHFLFLQGNGKGVKIWRSQHPGDGEEQEGVHWENGEVASGTWCGTADGGPGAGLLWGEAQAWLRKAGCRSRPLSPDIDCEEKRKEEPRQAKGSALLNRVKRGPSWARWVLWKTQLVWYMKNVSQTGGG